MGFWNTAETVSNLGENKAGSHRSPDHPGFTAFHPISRPDQRLPSPQV
jgi:hypothetical protein